MVDHRPYVGERVQKIEWYESSLCWVNLGSKKRWREEEISGCQVKGDHREKKGQQSEVSKAEEKSGEEGHYPEPNRDALQENARKRAEGKKAHWRGLSRRYWKLGIRTRTKKRRSQGGIDKIRRLKLYRHRKRGKDVIRGKGGERTRVTKKGV